MALLSRLFRGDRALEFMFGARLSPHTARGPLPSVCGHIAREHPLEPERKGSEQLCHPRPFGWVGPST
jgi:hypothetical protein